jgi:5-methylcytosine-specific restriction protein A
MKTYLFTWNPKRWDWSYYKKSISEVQEKGVCSESWSCGNTKSIHIGDRAFLLKQGDEPRGIIASGWIKSNVTKKPHWDNTKRKLGKKSLSIEIDWDVIEDYRVKIFPIQVLLTNRYSPMHWKPQASGVRIPDEVAEILEKDWSKLINRKHISVNIHFPEEIKTDLRLIEGAKKKAFVNSYERNPKARAICLNHYGLNCAVCGIDFETVYGELGLGFIHVHQLIQLSKIGKKYIIDPIKDLRPVCPNCHSMIHQIEPPLEIIELRKIIEGIKAPNNRL